MSKKKPNNFIAPIVIAGITVGFLASAYKFVFAKPKKQSSEIVKQQHESQNKSQEWLCSQSMNFIGFFIENR